MHLSPLRDREKVEKERAVKRRKRKRHTLDRNKESDTNVNVRVKQEDAREEGGVRCVRGDPRVQRGEMQQAVEQQVALQIWIVKLCSHPLSHTEPVIAARCVHRRVLETQPCVSHEKHELDCW